LETAMNYLQNKCKTQQFLQSLKKPRCTTAWNIKVCFSISCV